MTLDFQAVACYLRLLPPFSPSSFPLPLCPLGIMRQFPLSSPSFSLPSSLPAQSALEDITQVHMAVNLSLRRDILVEKCLGRRMCRECGGNFNVADIKRWEGAEHGHGIVMPPLLPPEGCETKLFIRDDDTEEVVLERLRIYEEQVRCLVCI